MKLPKIDSNDHVLVSSSRASRISYNSDEKMRFQYNVDRLLSVKSYLHNIIDKERQDKCFPHIDSFKSATQCRSSLTAPDMTSSVPAGKSITKLPSIKRRGPHL